MQNTISKLDELLKQKMNNSLLEKNMENMDTVLCSSLLEISMQKYKADLFQPFRTWACQVFTT